MKAHKNKKINNNKVVEKKLSKKISLKDRFNKYNGKNLSKDFTWDKDKGKEIL